MASVLGIDAAWTATQPSGVALIRNTDEGSWENVAVAPSYYSFLGVADGVPVNWGQPERGSPPEADHLLDAATRLLGGSRVDVVAIDMPLSLLPITARRAADRCVSRVFGAKGCSTHSPSPIRPGKISDTLSGTFRELGYPLAVTQRSKAETVLIEAYPHPALLSLLRRDYRVPYKISRASKYWPTSSPSDRTSNLLEQFQAIHQGLAAIIQKMPPFLSARGYQGPRSRLKGYEDALDALVCAWVGAKYLAGDAIRYGDDTAAIWVPATDNTSPSLCR